MNRRNRERGCREGGQHQQTAQQQQQRAGWLEGSSEDLKYGRLWTRAVWHPRARTKSHTGTHAADGPSGIRVLTEPHTDQPQPTPPLHYYSEKPLDPSAVRRVFVLFVFLQAALETWGSLCQIRDISFQGTGIISTRAGQCGPNTTWFTAEWQSNMEGFLNTDVI